MRKTAKRWADCNPAAMAKQSEAAIMYTFQDAKDDILKMAEALRVIGYPNTNIDQNDELYDSDNAKKYIRNNFSLEDLEHE